MKTFRSWDFEQSWLLPPSVLDFVPPEHPAHFVLSGLCVQVLTLCRKAGLVSLGHVAVDGTKIEANASKHKAMSYARMKQAEKELEGVVRGWFERAEEEDRLEDEKYGEERSGDEMPDWVANKEKRLQKIREAKAALEAEAKEEASRREEIKARGRKPKHNADGTPGDKSQRNFTDPDSKILTATNHDELASARRPARQRT